MTTVAAKERGIVFTAESVRAILAGTKTQSRLVIQPQPLEVTGDARGWMGCYEASALLNRAPFWGKLRCPYGKPGDALWVRETYARRTDVDPKTNLEKAVQYLRYKADGGDLEDEWHDYGRWRSPRFMPKWASRLRLVLTDVGVERVNDISEADAIAEGIREDVLPANEDHPQCICYVSQPDDNHAYVTAREAFAASWDSINQRRGYPFDSGAWVWVLKYERENA